MVLTWDTPPFSQSRCETNTLQNVQVSGLSPLHVLSQSLIELQCSKSKCHTLLTKSHGCPKEDSGIFPLVTLSHHLLCVGFFSPLFIASVCLWSLFAQAAVQHWPDYFWQELWITATILTQCCANFGPFLLKLEQQLLHAHKVCLHAYQDGTTLLL